MNGGAVENLQVVDSMRRRVFDVVMHEYANSSYENIDPAAYYVWEEVRRKEETRKEELQTQSTLSGKGARRSALVWPTVFV